MEPSFARRLGRRVLPAGVRRSIRNTHLTVWPPVGHVRMGHLRRTAPISADFGYDRGLPIDRYYIERFLADNARDVRGATLEFQDDAYARRFGGDALTSVEILNVECGYPGTTIAADLAVAEQLPAARFDCIVCTGVIQLVSDPYAAIRNLHRMLRTGGVVLATLPVITRIAREPAGAWEDQWRFTSSSADRLFTDVFGAHSVAVEWHGNPLVAVAFLMGLAASELAPAELDARHPDFEVLVGVRAVRQP